jgi:hypothetical protein
MYNYFASGSNRAGDIQGFHRVNIDIGIAAQEVVSRRGGILEAERELYKLKGTGRRVFIDSGAYSEVDFPGGVPTVVAPITHQEWELRLDLYERLAEVLGEQLYPVAPDKVAFQEDTLDRLKIYRHRIRRLHEYGANIIVPHQKGKASMETFHELAIDILGFSDFIVGFPMKKDATKVEDIAVFCDIMCPQRVHLLGIGPKSQGKLFYQALDAIEWGCMFTQVFCDSVAISGAAARTGGKGGGARGLTIASDQMVEKAEEAQWSEGAPGVGDYTDHVIEEIDHWLPEKKRSELVKHVEQLFGIIAPRGAKTHLRRWLHETGLACNDWVGYLINCYWHEYARSSSATWRKAESIKKHFGGKAGDALRRSDEE